MADTCDRCLRPFAVQQGPNSATPGCMVLLPGPGYLRTERLLDCVTMAAARYQARVLELEHRINTPHTDDWFAGVRLEAAHQQERWGAAHDTGKAVSDWFWLLGYLGGKALASAMAGDVEKAKHHTISSAAVLLNWFRHMAGDSGSEGMRPGIEEPRG